MFAAHLYLLTLNMYSCIKRVKKGSQRAQLTQAVCFQLITLDCSHLFSFLITSEDSSMDSSTRVVTSTKILPILYVQES